MLELLDNANEEIKRVDHLVYVTLKYTRTVDVLQNIVARMVDGYGYLMKLLLELHYRENNIDAKIPKAPILQCDKLSKIFKDHEQIQNNIGLYMLLRKINRVQSFEKEQEFRRHVCMIAMIDGLEELVNIDIITQYYLMLKDFYGFVAENIKSAGIKEERVEEDDWYE
jgi:hypothetical protein